MPDIIKAHIKHESPVIANHDPNIVAQIMIVVVL